MLSDFQAGRTFQVGANFYDARPASECSFVGMNEDARCVSFAHHIYLSLRGCVARTLKGGAFYNLYHRGLHNKLRDVHTE